MKVIWDTTNTEELTIPPPPVFVLAILNLGKMRGVTVTPTDAIITYINSYVYQFSKIKTKSLCAGSKNHS